MSFKKVSDYNEERYGNMFLLRNDGDSADVIFLYQSIDDALVADVHYIKSASYSGYVHCCGRNCPACNKGIRVQNKLFIPLYNISAGEVQFFDRSVRFENVLNTNVFSRYPNPSEFVFRITRHGEAGSMSTTYAIEAVGRNTEPQLSFSSILKANNITFPDGYNRICKELSVPELENMLNANNMPEDTTNYTIPDYQVKPRISGDTVNNPPLNADLLPVESDGSDSIIPSSDEDVQF